MADNLTYEQRSYCMSRIRSKDTSVETMVRSELHKRGLRFRKHVKQLAGTPDVVFPKSKLVVFLDGDFWHGYRFNQWKDTLPPFWKDKISKNRERDRKNFSKLRRKGWRVVRIWGHEVKADLEAVVTRIQTALRDPVCD